ncbi:ligase-associated DNA damage response exonuclease [Sanyastnella coralliicola]|uniref:ligase-associated DNA damage response exonuclease n=1 Tax=Sanyastnella coralliicola TaxID=3069118 RepID=UPI0027B8A079|nr:ligase-associated DNA damage response exonuclease [Longitalea sp. SCSIO 12813]
MTGLLSYKAQGIYCEAGDFFIDPWRPVNKALITHAHADHSRWGMKQYLAHHRSIPVMRHRLGEINVSGVEYEEEVNINGVKVSFHPAGHIIGSSQIRVEYKGEVWVVSGDYRTGESDHTCAPFEPVKCHAFITESTFGLPIFRWQTNESLFADINAWWSSLARNKKNAVLFAYSLGKAQRVLAGVDPSIGPIYTHGAVENTNEVLRADGMILPETTRITQDHKSGDIKGALIIAPPSAMGTPWMKRLQPYETAIASGWMQVRGMRRRRNADKGFVLSDHADWEGLNHAIAETGAERIYVTHGYSDIYSKYLSEQGYDARVVETEYGEEQEEKEANA